MSSGIKNLVSVEFREIQEPWNTYSGDDGSLLVIRFALKRVYVFIDDEGAEQFRIDGTTLTTVKAVPDHLRKPPTFIYTKINITDSDIDEEVDFDVETEDWNKYYVFWKGKKFMLKVKSGLLYAIRTKHHDQFGLPIYSFNFTTAITSKEEKDSFPS